MYANLCTWSTLCMINSLLLSNTDPYPPYQFPYFHTYTSHDIFEILPRKEIFPLLQSSADLMAVEWLVWRTHSGESLGFDSHFWSCVCVSRKVLTYAVFALHSYGRVIDNHIPPKRTNHFILCSQLTTAMSTFHWKVRSSYVLQRLWLYRMSDAVFWLKIDSWWQWGYGTCHGNSFPTAQKCIFAPQWY